jgi:hypothetical protein
MDRRFYLGGKLRRYLFHAVFPARVLDAFFQDFPFRLAPGLKVTIHANVSALHNHSHNRFLLIDSCYSVSRAIPEVDVTRGGRVARSVSGKRYFAKSEIQQTLMPKNRFWRYHFLPP